jgi:hypothetical protein
MMDGAWGERGVEKFSGFWEFGRAVFHKLNLNMIAGTRRAERSRLNIGGTSLLPSINVPPPTFFSSLGLAFRIDMPNALLLAQVWMGTVYYAL